MKIYLSSKGLRPDRDNAPVLNRVIEAAKEGSTLVWKDGRYPINSTIMQGKALHWEGAEDTWVDALQPLTFAEFTGGSREAVINRVNFKGFYPIQDGPKGPTFDGLLVNTIVHLSYLTVRNAWGNAVTCSANMATGRGNASFSYFGFMNLIECKENGLYFQGGDANQCEGRRVDVRDCNGIAIRDDSYLGNQFYACMTHNNKGGSYRAGDANNFTGFYGCYAEGGQPPIYLDGHATWHGGLASNGIDVAGRNVRCYAYGDAVITYLYDL